MIPILLIIFEHLLRLRSFYNDIVTVKDFENTVTAIGLLPVVWLILWWTRVPDSWVIWGLVNLWFLWALIKDIVVPVMEVAGLGRIRKLFII